MKKILAASENPVKINAAQRGFEKMFPKEKFIVKGISINSGVEDQPMNDEETYFGAYNRAKKAQKQNPQYDFFVGIEGGIQKWKAELSVFAWVVILSKNKIGKARTAAYFLPANVAKLILKGKELGDAMDMIFNKQNVKQKNGAIGILTDDAIDRTNLYIEAVSIALIPFKKKELY